MKPLFVFHVDNVVDLITNSSSELFILDGKTQDVVIEMIEGIHPNWRGEYEDPRQLSELSDDEISTISDYIDIGGFEFYNFDTKTHEVYYTDYSLWSRDRKKLVTDILGLPFEEAFTNYEELINQPRTDECKWGKHLQESEKLVKLKREKLTETYPNSWFLFSHDDNPEWDYQELLMNRIGRYWSKHLM